MATICQCAGCREPATQYAQLWQYYVGVLCTVHAMEAERKGVKVWPIEKEVD